MPSSVVHLYAAYKLKDYFKAENLPQFFLGAISPDAVNVKGFAEEKIRYAAHIRSKNPSEWLLNIKEFISENSDKYANEADFFNGFILHLLTDIAWDEAVQPKLFSVLLRIGVSEEELRREKWQELYRFNGYLMKNNLWNFIKEELSKAKAVAVSTVSEQLLEEFLENLLSENYSKASDEPPLVLRDSDIDDTVAKVIELYEKIRKRSS